MNLYKALFHDFMLVMVTPEFQRLHVALEEVWNKFE